ncbi:MAG: NUDIX domain-containing protein [Mycobacteriaceae bacterium]
MAAAIVDELDRPRRLLAARRTAPESLAGGWEVPGGKVEPGEDPACALHREIAEELGVGVRLGQGIRGPLPEGAFDLGGGVRMRVWLAELVGGEPAPLADHDALRWLDARELYSVSWLAADLPVVREVAVRFARARCAHRVRKPPTLGP